jgi:hypothetical protein
MKIVLTNLQGILLINWTIMKKKVINRDDQQFYQYQLIEQSKNNRFNFMKLFDFEGVLIISIKRFPKVKPQYHYKTFYQGQTTLSLPKVKPHYLYKIFSQGQTTFFLQNPFSRSKNVLWR